jgi:hypothetical protein
MEGSKARASWWLLTAAETILKDRSEQNAIKDGIRIIGGLGIRYDSERTEGRRIRRSEWQASRETTGRSRIIGAGWEEALQELEGRGREQDELLGIFEFWRFFKIHSPPTGSPILPSIGFKLTIFHVIFIVSWIGLLSTTFNYGVRVEMSAPMGFLVNWWHKRVQVISKSHSSEIAL